jgi:hypothetical protein
MSEEISANVEEATVPLPPPSNELIQRTAPRTVRRN